MASAMHLPELGPSVFNSDLVGQTHAPFSHKPPEVVQRVWAVSASGAVVLDPKGQVPSSKAATVLPSVSL